SLRPHPVGHPSSSTWDSASRAVPSSIRVRRDGYREAGEWQQAGGDQRDRAAHTDLRRFLDTSVSYISTHGLIVGTSYGAGEAGAQATAQSERTKPVLAANRFHAVSQASMMSARLRNTELASQWLRR